MLSSALRGSVMPSCPWQWPPSYPGLSISRWRPRPLLVLSRQESTPTLTKLSHFPRGTGSWWWRKPVAKPGTGLRQVLPLPVEKLSLGSPCLAGEWLWRRVPCLTVQKGRGPSMPGHGPGVHMGHSPRVLRQVQQGKRCRETHQ